MRRGMAVVLNKVVLSKPSAFASSPLAEATSSSYTATSMRNIAIKASPASAENFTYRVSIIRFKVTFNVLKTPAVRRSLRLRFGEWAYRPYTVSIIESVLPN